MIDPTAAAPAIFGFRNPKDDLLSVHFATPFSFSKVRRPPRPSIPIKTVISALISNGGRGNVLPVAAMIKAVNGSTMKW